MELKVGRPAEGDELLKLLGELEARASKRKVEADSAPLIREDRDR